MGGVTVLPSNPSKLGGWMVFGWFWTRGGRGPGSSPVSHWRFARTRGHGETLRSATQYVHKNRWIVLQEIRINMGALLRRYHHTCMPLSL